MTLPWIRRILDSHHRLDDATGDESTPIERLRQEILADGIPAEEQHDGGSSSRSIAWKVLLGVLELETESYLHYVSLGASAVHDKIADDTFRTLATDAGFQNVVSEDMLMRLLDAFVWRSGADSNDLDFTYVQGMNVLAAPFLYVMPSEVEAFACFAAFIEKNCPLYVQPTLEGVHRGLKLVDKCLEELEPDLYKHLSSKGLSAELYAFAPIMTFSAGTPPLQEALRLWDFLLADGVHLNILCIVAQLHLIRAELQAESSPMKLLRSFPPLNASATIALCRQYVKDLPPVLCDHIARHAWDSTLRL